MDIQPRIHNYYNDIIIFIFLIAGVCVGLPALLWALYVLHNHRKNGGQISAFVVLLLLNDLLELLLSFCIVSFLYSDNTITFTLDINRISWSEHVHDYHNSVYIVVYVLWGTLRIGGLYLHQLVALQSILSLKNPACSAHIFSPACSVNLGIILWLALLACQFLSFDLLLNTVLCILPLCILAVTCLRTCIGSPNHDRVPHSGVKAGSAVLIVSTLTLFAVCVPSVTVFVYVLLRQPYMDMYDIMFAFLVSVRVVSDPIQCVLVCKEKLRAQTQPTNTQLNTDHQPV